MVDDIEDEGAQRVTLRTGMTYRLTHASGDTARMKVDSPVLNTGDEVIMIIAPDLEGGPIRIEVDQGLDEEGRERADEDT